MVRNFLSAAIVMLFVTTGYAVDLPLDPKNIPPIKVAKNIKFGDFHMGSPLREVRATRESKYSDYQYRFNDNIPKTNKVRTNGVLVDVSVPNYITSLTLRRDRQGVSETTEIYFTSPLSESRIYRSNQNFNFRQHIPLETIEADLKAKYGAPGVRLTPQPADAVYELYWLFDREGIRSTQNRPECAVITELARRGSSPDKNLDAVDNNCGGVVFARILTPLGSNKTMVFALEISTYDATIATSDDYIMLRTMREVAGTVDATPPPQAKPRL